MGMAARFAEINGHRLRYDLRGEGPLTIFGHGLMGSMEQLAPESDEMAALLKRVRLLTYDARGHGQSGGPLEPGGYTWEALGRDMSAFIDHVGEDSAILGGASMGAATSLWVALEHPEKVRGLVLVMPPPLARNVMEVDAERQAIQLLEIVAAAVENFGIEKTVEVVRMMPGFAASPEAAEERAKWLLAQNPLTLKFAIRGLVASPFHDPEQYRRINVPTLVLAHEGDGLHPVRSATLLKEMIPDCTLHVAPQAEYWKDHPEEVAVEVERFLERVG